MRKRVELLALLLVAGCMLGGCGKTVETIGTEEAGMDEVGATEAGTVENGSAGAGEEEQATAGLETQETIPDIEKTYWTITVGEKQITLKESADAQDEAALYCIGADGSEVLLRRLTGSAERFHAESFSNLLAHDGFLLYCEYDFYRDWKYYALEGEELLLLAYSWGSSPEENEYIADLDGDGDNEMVHFVTYMADGVDEVGYFDWRDGQAMQAVVENMDAMSREQFQPEMLTPEKIAGLEFWQVMDW